MTDPNIERVNARFENAQPIAVGRIVFVTLPRPDVYSGTLESRPAIVVKAWSNTCLNVVAFLDGSNDDRYQDEGATLGRLTQWLTSVTYDGGELREIDDPAAYVAKKTVTIYNPHTWHWPPRS